VSTGFSHLCLQKKGDIENSDEKAVISKCKRDRRKSAFGERETQSFRKVINLKAGGKYGAEKI